MKGEKDENGRSDNQIAVRTSDAAESMTVKLVGVVLYPHIN